MATTPEAVEGLGEKHRAELQRLMKGACTCGKKKQPAVSHHAVDCKYRLIGEIVLAVDYHVPWPQGF